MKTGSEKGFSLLEVLIVGVIISILAAVAIPRMGFEFSTNRLRTSTASVTSMFYMARMKAVNDGLPYGVMLSDNGDIDIVRDPYGVHEVLSPTNHLENGVTFAEITFTNQEAVFTSFGQLDKNCLPLGELLGYVYLANDKGDTTIVEVSMITGRIRETNL